MKKILGLLFLVSTITFAKNLTLDEAINLSLKNSKKIEVSSSQLKIGQLNLSRAFKTALPTVMYQGNYSRMEHTERKIYGRETHVEDENLKPNFIEKDGYTSKIVISQPLFQGGAILGGVKGAKANSNIMEFLFLKEKRDVRLNTIKIFSNIIKFQKDLEALKISKMGLDKRYEEQKNKLDMKLIIKADLLKTEVAVLETESNIIQIKNLIAVEKKKLKIETGLNSIEELTLMDLDIPEKLSESIDFKNDMVVAKTKSLSALIAKNNVDYKKAERMIAFSENLPKVNAFLQYGGYERNKFENTLHNEEWRGGVSVSWSLFNFGSGIDKFRIANEKVKIEETNESIALDNIEIELTTAYSDVLRYEKLRKAMKNSMLASQKNYEMDMERYKANLISTQDFLNSEAQYTKSKVNYNKAEANYLISFEKYRSLLI